MDHIELSRRAFVAAGLLLPALSAHAADESQGTAAKPEDKKSTGDSKPVSAEDALKAADAAGVKKELYRGQVVSLRDALKKRGVASYPEFDNQFVLETPGGNLVPIVPDWRGRAFYQDERLRDRPVEIVGFRKEGVPYVQALMIFTRGENDQRQYMDYWCDICSIPMYEIKPCDCCQADIAIRFQDRELPEYLKSDKPALP